MGVSPEIARWLQGLRPSAHLPPTPRAASGLVYFFRLSPGFCSPTARVTPGYRLPPLYDENLIWYTPQASAKMLAGCLGY